MLRLLYLQGHLLDNLFESSLQRYHIEIGPKVLVIPEVGLGKYGMGRQPLRPGETCYIFVINPACHHLKPSMESGVAEGDTLSFHSEIKISTDMMNVISAVPGLV